MACYHPLKAFPIGKTPAGKIDYKIVEYACQAVVRHRRSDVWTACKEIPPFVAAYEVVTDCITVPCGQCIGCRIDYSREWANRMLMELPYHDSAYFITLTYDPLHVPMVADVDLYSGVSQSVLTLFPRDLELFWKRLRRDFPADKIRYYAAGEYGEQTWRPHYHAIVFGLHLRDLELLRVVRGSAYYTSKQLQRVWSKGHVLIGAVTWQSCAYVARYCTKKAHGRDAELYRSFSLEPEFSRMSKKPGLGYYWYRDHPDLYEHRTITLSTPDGGKSFKPPRYFDKLFEKDDPARYEKVKVVRREVAEAVTKAIMEKTDLDMEAYLQVQEELADNRLKQLMRSDL